MFCCFCCSDFKILGVRFFLKLLKIMFCMFILSWFVFVWIMSKILLIKVLSCLLFFWIWLIMILLLLLRFDLVSRVEKFSIEVRGVFSLWLIKIMKLDLVIFRDFSFLRVFVSLEFFCFSFCFKWKCLIVWLMVFVKLVGF